VHYFLSEHFVMITCVILRRKEGEALSRKHLPAAGQYVPNYGIPGRFVNPADAKTI
jgi:hypothetical protein